MVALTSKWIAAKVDGHFTFLCVMMKVSSDEHSMRLQYDLLSDSVESVVYKMFGGIQKFRPWDDRFHESEDHARKALQNVLTTTISSTERELVYLREELARL